MPESPRGYGLSGRFRAAARITVYGTKRPFNGKPLNNRFAPSAAVFNTTEGFCQRTLPDHLILKAAAG